MLAGIKRSRLDRVQRIPERIRTLTHTELTLLRATATGKTNGEIAKERGVTRNAVKRRLMSAYEKLGVKNRTRRSQNSPKSSVAEAPRRIVSSS